MKNKTLSYLSYSLLIIALILVSLAKVIPSWGQFYGSEVYPWISRILPPVSGIFPFSVGDVFITLSILGILIYPFIARRRKKKWKFIFLNLVVYLLWVYIWFYLAWGLNYSQPNFYQRTGVPYSAYTPEKFQGFIDEYIDLLNNSYIPIDNINKENINRQIIALYQQTDESLGIHRLRNNPRVKTMVFSSLFSSMGISGYMGPFFCEFNLNGELLPTQYPATYAHELAHLLGITGEAEANFYAYQICIRSSDPAIRFCGYFSVMNYVLGNARGFMTDEEYKAVFLRIKPEIIDLARYHQEYWQKRYSPTIGNIQDWIYDLYLKGNKISSGRKNYSEVVGLLISWREFNQI